MAVITKPLGVGAVSEGARTMLDYIPYPREDMADKKWLWIDLPNGDRIMLLDAVGGISLPEPVVCALAKGVLKDDAKAS